MILSSRDDGCQGESTIQDRCCETKIGKKEGAITDFDGEIVGVVERKRRLVGGIA